MVKINGSNIELSIDTISCEEDINNKRIYIDVFERGSTIFSKYDFNEDEMMKVLGIVLCTIIERSKNKKKTLKKIKKQIKLYKGVL